MNTPWVTERPQALEPASHDPFIDDLAPMPDPKQANSRCTITSRPTSRAFTLTA
jgi:hypothetical protein